MANNPIEQVREAELQAERIVREALAEATVLVDTQHNEAVEAADRVVEAARQEAAGRIADAHKQGQKAMENAAGDLTQMLDELAQTARSRQPKAVAALLEML